MSFPAAKAAMVRWQKEDRKKAAGTGERHPAPLLGGFQRNGHYINALLFL